MYTELYEAQLHHEFLNTENYIEKKIAVACRYNSIKVNKLIHYAAYAS
jgi:hypothetical protein